MDTRGQRTLNHGDLVGQRFFGDLKAKEVNDEYNQDAINRIQQNDGLRYVRLPGGSWWPYPKEIEHLMPDELK